MRKLSIATLVLMLCMAGCGIVKGPWGDSQVVGEWASPTSGATIQFHADGSFDATDFPSPPDSAGKCNPAEYDRGSLAGTWSADEHEFIYLNELGFQIWKGATLTGTATLMVRWCDEAHSPTDTYIKQSS